MAAAAAGVGGRGGPPCARRGQRAGAEEEEARRARAGGGEGEGRGEEARLCAHASRPALVPSSAVLGTPTTVTFAKPERMLLAGTALPAQHPNSYYY